MDRGSKKWGSFYAMGGIQAASAWLALKPINCLQKTLSCGREGGSCFLGFPQFFTAHLGGWENTRDGVRQ